LEVDLLEAAVSREDGITLRACRFNSRGAAEGWAEEARAWLTADETQDGDPLSANPGGQLGDNIEFFFRPPEREAAPRGIQSTLYLLRREVLDCFVGREMPEDQAIGQDERHRLFASAMVIFAGIDLLAKFTCDRGGVEERFEDYLVRFALDPLRNLGSATIQSPQPVASQASRIFDFRNALMHSFGLHHEERGGQVIPLVLVRHESAAFDVVSLEEDRWILSLDDLYETFVNSIRRYQRMLNQGDEVLVARFNREFERFGKLQVWDDLGPGITQRTLRTSPTI
jgi:hypothetical protein